MHEEERMAAIRRKSDGRRILTLQFKREQVARALGSGTVATAVARQTED